MWLFPDKCLTGFSPLLFVLELSSALLFRIGLVPIYEKIIVELLIDISYKCKWTILIRYCFSSFLLDSSSIHLWVKMSSKCWLTCNPECFIQKNWIPGLYKSHLELRKHSYNMGSLKNMTFLCIWILTPRSRALY